MELWTAVSKSAIVGQNTKPKSAILSCDESEESGAGGLTLSREEGIHNWCHDVVDGNVYAVYLVEQVWTGVKSTITEDNVCIR